MKFKLLIITSLLSISAFSTEYEIIENKNEAELIREAITVELDNSTLDCNSSVGDWNLSSVNSMFSFPVRNAELVSNNKVSISESPDESIKFDYERKESFYHYIYEYIVHTDDNFHELTSVNVKVHEVLQERKINKGSFIEPAFEMKAYKKLVVNTKCTVKEL